MKQNSIASDNREGGQLGSSMYTVPSTYALLLDYRRRSDKGCSEELSDGDTFNTFLVNVHNDRIDKIRDFFITHEIPLSPPYYRGTVDLVKGNG